MMKRENQLTSWGSLAFAFGALAFLPNLAGEELMILSWLGSMQVPVGISAMVVGGAVFGLGKLQQIRYGPPAGGGPNEPSGRIPPPAQTAASDVRAPIQPNAKPTVQPNVLSNQAKPNAGPPDRP
jgi:hypothetical protein